MVFWLNRNITIENLYNAVKYFFLINVLLKNPIINAIKTFEQKLFAII